MALLTGGALLGAAAIGGATSAIASSKAAKAQKYAADQSAAVQREMFERQVALQEPFRQGGMTAQNQILQLLGIGGDATAADYGSMAKPFGAQQFEQDPGYAFRQSEGMKALERSAAARGGLMSGATGKALQRYGQDLGSQEFSAAYGRLAGLADVGPRAAGIMSGLGERYGQTAGQNLMAGGQAAAQGMLGAGAARASGYMGTANALTGALGQYLNYNQNQQLLNRLLPSGGGGGSPIVPISPYQP